MTNPLGARPRLDVPARIALMVVLLSQGCAARSERSGERDILRSGSTDASSPEASIPGPAASDASTEPPTTAPGARGCQKLDLLFVVDDSGSMAEEQANLAANFPRFMEVLRAFEAGAGLSLDYRIGVTTTAKRVTIETVFPDLPIPIPPEEIMGDDGKLRGGCGLSEPFITPSTPSASEALACLANVGTAGSPYEMPLYAMELALTDRISDGSNAGFLRDDALLAIVFLTDEEDCSRRDNPIQIMVELLDPMAYDACDISAPEIDPVARYVERLDALKGGRDRWAVAAIAGPGPDTCMSSFGSAVPATRLSELVRLAGDNGVFASICGGDLSGALGSALETIAGACEDYPLI